MWGIIGLIMTGISALASAYSTYGKYSGEAAMYGGMAAVSKDQATLARRTAAYEEKRFREKGTKLKSTQRAAAGTTGVRLSSFESVFTETARNLELDALTIRYKGEVEAVGLEEQAELYEEAKSESRKAGKAGAAGSILGGVGTVLGGISKIFK